MQTINLDISMKRIIPLLYAKQGDVGRKFKAILTDGGIAYPVPAGAAVSVWYSGASGEGNYTDIGADSAVSVSGNEITVELITQMLANPGAGMLCLVVNTADGDELGTWNIPYCTEPRPGMNSAEAQAYFTAFSNAVQNLPYPDASLSIAGKAADAAATGTALAGKAPAGYGLGGDAQPIDSWNNAVRNGYYRSSYGTPDGDGNEWHGIVANYSTILVTQLVWKTWATGAVMASRRIYNGVADPWEWVNPPHVSRRGIPHHGALVWDACLYKTRFTRAFHWNCNVCDWQWILQYCSCYRNC